MSASKKSVKEDPQYQYKRELYAVYQAQRAEADKVALELGGRYEKMLSLVAGGALIVSITFIEKIAPSPVGGSKWLALAAWLLLGGANVATLFAISASHKAQQKKIENLDSEISQRLYPDDPAFRDLDVASNPYVKKVQSYNQLSIWCAVIGLGCLIFFVFVNFPSPKNEQKQHQSDAPAQRASKQEVLRADANSDSPTAAAQTARNEEDQKMKTPPPPPPTPPQRPSQVIQESYVPTPSPVAPPPPPPKGK